MENFFLYFYYLIIELRTVFNEITQSVLAFVDEFIGVYRSCPLAQLNGTKWRFRDAEQSVPDMANRVWAVSTTRNLLIANFPAHSYFWRFLQPNDQSFRSFVGETFALRVRSWEFIFPCRHFFRTEAYLGIRMLSKVSQNRYFQRNCVDLLSSVLNHISLLNDVDASLASRFHAVCKPRMALRDYIDRIFRYIDGSVEILVSAVMYIFRFSEETGMAISSLNLHRLLITSAVISMKYWEDRPYTNRYMANVGGISLCELNYLEASFLRSIDYALEVSPSNFENFCREVCQLEATFMLERVNVHLSNALMLKLERKDECRGQAYEGTLDRSDSYQ